MDICSSLSLVVPKTYLWWYQRHTPFYPCLGLNRGLEIHVLRPYDAEGILQCQSTCHNKYSCNKLIKQYNASIDLANVIQLSSFSSYDTSKIGTQAIASKWYFKLKWKKVTFSSCKCFLQFCGIFLFMTVQFVHLKVAPQDTHADAVATISVSETSKNEPSAGSIRPPVTTSFPLFILRIFDQLSSNFV